MGEPNKLKCILLIDDDEIANFLHQKMLEDLEIAERVDVVTNGSEAIEYITKVCIPEVIFLDINMPIMDGFEFMKIYNELSPSPDLKICTLSSSTHNRDIEKMEELGVKHYLVKPLRERDVVSLMRKIA